MSTIITRREAQCVMGLLAASPAFVTSGALAAALDLQQASVKASLHAVNARLAVEPQRPQAFIEYRHGYGWVILGRGDRLDDLYREAVRMIARDAATVAADAKAGRIIARSHATSPAYLGFGG